MHWLIMTERDRRTWVASLTADRAGYGPGSPRQPAVFEQHLPGCLRLPARPLAQRYAASAASICRVVPRMEKCPWPG
jgi:hypothetical protein